MAFFIVPVETLFHKACPACVPVTRIVASYFLREFHSNKNID
jgi:hypothetical protein